MTIKLNLLFIAMDLLTLLAYPIVFMHGKMRRIIKSQGVLVPAPKMTVTSVIQVFDPV